MTSSCHPIGCTKNIPFSLGLRIVRTCTEPETRDKRLSELKELLIHRDYPERLIDSALTRARAIPMRIALRKVIRKKEKNSKRPIFALKYDPRLPSISNIQSKHWRSITSQDKHMAQMFPQPSLTAFRRQNNLRDILIRAKVPEKGRPFREQKGMTKCDKGCPSCPYIKMGKEIRIKENSYWYMNRKLNCQIFNVVYMLECDKENCQQRYIGERGRLKKKD